MYKFKFSAQRLLFLFNKIKTILDLVLQFNSPIDKLLSNFFKANKNLGQLDRAFISETIFCIVKNKSLIEYFCGKNIGLAIQNYKILLVALKIFQIVELSAEFLNALNSKNSEKLCLANLENISNSENLFANNNDNDIKPTILYSIPDFLYTKFLQIFNNNTQELHKFLYFQNSSASLDLRVNIYKTKRQNAISNIISQIISNSKNLQKESIEKNIEITEFSPLGLRLRNKIAINKLPIFLNGEIEVQDQASQIIGLLVGAKRREMIADFCAGAGGKTLLLASQMQNSGNLYAFDISENRLNRLKPRLARSGVSNIHPIKISNLADNRLKRLAAKFDRVLVDAPCSGMGTLRRNPDLKWRQTPEKIADLVIQQQQILEAAAKLVKSGGRLIYATCSLLPEENSQQIEKFLENNTQFKIINIADEILNSKNPPIDNAEQFFNFMQNNSNGEFDYIKSITKKGFFMSIPHIHNCDGFFAAIMQKV